MMLLRNCDQTLFTGFTDAANLPEIGKRRNVFTCSRYVGSRNGDVESFAENFWRLVTALDEWFAEGEQSTVVIRVRLWEVADE